MPGVARRRHAGDGGKPDAWILHLSLQQIHELVLDLSVETVGALAHDGATWPDQAGCSATIW
jgi:hypothetical protein